MSNITLNVESAAERVRVALGQQPAELVLKNATYLNVFLNAWETGDIAITDGRIVGTGEYRGRTELDMTGKTVVPGFIDGHIHLESSLVAPVEFAKAVIPHGTTAVVTDPHEIANVLGTQGIDYILEATQGLPLDVWLMVPSCVPATPEDESGAELTSQDIIPYLSNPRVLGLAEMMNYPGILGQSPDVLAKCIAALKAGKKVDGHAPGLSGPSLNAYIASGITSDHECSTYEEALEKAGKGQWIMIREGTAAQNLESLALLLMGPAAQRCLFVTDDKHPESLLQKGHIDQIIRKAILLGADPITALKCASYQAAQAFGLTGYGAIAPGYAADLAVLGSVQAMDVEMTLKAGQVVYQQGQSLQIKQPAIDPVLAKRALTTFDMAPVQADSFALTKPAGLLKMIPGQIITENGGMATGVNVAQDILKIAVLERHHHTGHTGIGYVQGYGLKHGAIATSIAHDSHNLIVIGTNDMDMAVAAERVRQLEGGIVIALDSQIVDELPLPIAGLMSDLSLDEVNAHLERMKEKAAALGVDPGVDPFMTLSFMSLPVIPALRVLTKGVFDVENWKYVE